VCGFYSLVVVHKPRRLEGELAVLVLSVRYKINVPFPRAWVRNSSIASRIMSLSVLCCKVRICLIKLNGWSSSGIDLSCSPESDMAGSRLVDERLARYDV